MRYLIASMLTVLVACEGTNSLAPLASSKVERPIVPEEQQYGELESELSEADMESLALTQANALRESTDGAYVSCTILATYKGRSLYEPEDNALGLLTVKGKGEVGKFSKQDPGDLVWVWFPVSLSERLTRASLAAAICYED